MVKDDAYIYHKWRNDLEVMFSTSPTLDLYSIEETKHFVENIILGSSNSKSYIIEDNETNKPIGITSLVNIDVKNRNAELIIDIGEKSYWGKGLGTEAVRTILEYAFLELNFHRISLRVFSLNPKAIHIYTKLGFKQEGVSRQSLYRNGEWHDIINMSILKDEYLEI